MTRDSMDLPIRSVFFSQIDWTDTAYRITYHRPIEHLLHSIKNIGLQRRPILQEKKSDRFRIVAGYRRLQALQKINKDPVFCKISTLETAERDLVLFNINENLDRGFNVVETALVLIKLSVWIEEDELVQNYLPLLNLPPRQEILKRYLCINEMSPIYQPALLQGRLFPETVETVVRDFSSPAHLIFALFIFLHWGFQKQREFLSDLKELSLRRHDDPEAILSASPVPDFLHQSHWTSQQKGESLRDYFRTLLFPILTENENRFKEIISNLNLNPGTRIFPPPFFEGGRYGLDIRFSNPTELKASLEKILQALEDKKLDDLP